MIDTVNNVLKELYGQAPWQKAAVNNAAIIGSVLGQVAFGVGGDLLGRKWCFVATSVLIILDLRGTFPLDGEVVRALSWLCLVLAIGATALVAWRLIRPPGPAEFLARDVGIYIAMGAAIVALGASIGVVRPRD